MEVRENKITAYSTGGYKYEIELGCPEKIEITPFWTQKVISNSSGDYVTSFYVQKIIELKNFRVVVGEGN